MWTRVHILSKMGRQPIYPFGLSPGIYLFPAMVFSQTREEYDQKFAEIQAELKNMGYDEVTAYYKDAWETAKTNYDALTGK